MPCLARGVFTELTIKAETARFEASGPRLRSPTKASGVVLSLAASRFAGQTRQAVPREHLRRLVAEPLEMKRKGQDRAVSHQKPAGACRVRGLVQAGGFCSIAGRPLSAKQKQYLKVRKGLLEVSGASVTEPQPQGLSEVVIKHNP